jgi:hypothetical protein
MSPFLNTFYRNSTSRSRALMTWSRRTSYLSKISSNVRQPSPTSSNNSTLPRELAAVSLLVEEQWRKSSVVSLSAWKANFQLWKLRSVESEELLVLSVECALLSMSIVLPSSVRKLQTGGIAASPS